MIKATDQTKTLNILRKAMERQNPVTISYVRADGTETVRTIEIYEIPEELTKGGKQIVKAMDRETGNTRSWRLDRILSLTVHRSQYLIPKCEKHNTHPAICFEQGKHDVWCARHEMSSYECFGVNHDALNFEIPYRRYSFLA